MTTMNTQLGWKKETTYGTPVTVDRFLEFNRYQVRAKQGRVESQGLRSGGVVDRSDRTEPYPMGAEGPIEIDVPTKGFGGLLELMLGSIATAGPTDSNYTHTATIGSLLGKSATIQANKVFHPSGTSQPVTLHGAKVTDWALSMDAMGTLLCSLGIDAEEEDTSTSLATVAYPSDTRIFSWVGGSITVAGTSVEMTRWGVNCNNSLNTSRYYVRASALKKEPTASGRRQISTTFQADWTDLTQYNRFKSATRAGMFAQIIATFDGPIAHGGTTVPRLEVTLPACRFDDVQADIDGPGELTQDVTAKVMWDGTNSPVTITYRTTDVTP